MCSRPLLAGTLLFVLARLVVSGKTDPAYQAWAEKVYKEEDAEEAVKKGNAIACAFCQIVAGSVQKQFNLNKQRVFEERFGEEDMTSVLEELCDGIAPRIAKAMKGYKKDAEMICKRVVRENVGDMIDAVSLGEDMNEFCKENGQCPMRLDSMMGMVKKMTEAASREDSDRGEL
ncbi:unnamed protein product [Prorocentrum cordatum]|nr:unnamed protein product [Polarella glacialis]